MCTINEVIRSLQRERVRLNEQIFALDLKIDNSDSLVDSHIMKEKRCDLIKCRDSVKSDIEMYQDMKDDNQVKTGQNRR